MNQRTRKTRSIWLEQLEVRNLLANNPPTPIDHTRTIPEDSGEIRIPVITDEIVGSDDDLDPIEIVSVTSLGPSQGTATHDFAVVYYTPAPNFTGTDSFTYTVTDAFVFSNIAGQSGTATITIEVTPVNDPPTARDDSFNAIGTVPVNGNLLSDNGNGADMDLDGDSLTVQTTPVSNASKGSVVLSSNGDFTYTPNSGAAGIDSFSYRISDGSLNDTASVTITIDGPPVARDDSFTVDEDSTLNGNVLSNNGQGVDFDPNNDPLTVDSSPVQAPSNGTLTLNSNGSFSYVPNPNYHGSDGFSYRLSDGTSTSTATVSITVASVNDPPVARDDSASGSEDNSINGNVLNNNGNGADTDSDGGSLTVSLLTGPTHGTVSLNSNGSYTYSPNTNFHGSDALTYRLFDGQGGSDDATLSLTIQSINDTPVAKNDSFSGPQDASISGNVLSDNGNGADSDVDDAVLIVTETPFVPPSNGSLDLSSDGSFTYAPNAGFVGSDSFEYEVADANSAKATAVVSLSISAVNQPPNAKDDSFNGPEDTVISGNVLNNNGSGADEDVDGDTLSVSPLADPSHGSLTLNTDGSFNYTPAANFSGSDTFTYLVNDGQGGTDNATVAINIQPVNDPPVAKDDTFVGNFNLPIQGNVLTNNGQGIDLDVDGDGLTVDTTPVQSPQNGSLQLNADGQFTYTPNAGFSGADAFQYRVHDGNGLDATASVSLTILSATNTAPIAMDDQFMLEEDHELNGDVGADNGNGLDQDPDGDLLTFALLTGPSAGQLDFDPDGSFTFTPPANFSGEVEFTYEIADGGGGTDNAVAHITVNPANDLPVAHNDTFTVAQNSQLSGNVLADNGSGADFDVEDATLSVDDTPLEAPSNGSLTISSDGSFVYAPVEGFSGNDSFQYTLRDSEGGSSVGVVNITVEDSANAQPVAADDHFTGLEDSVISGNLFVDNGNGADLDPNSDPLSAVGPTPTQPQHGQVVINHDGTFTYTPDADYFGGDSFSYQLQDGKGGTSTATVTLEITPLNDIPAARDDAFTVLANGTLNASVLADNGNGPDRDPDQGGLTVRPTRVRPRFGSFSMNADGTFQYVPNPDFQGTDRFTYSVTDNNGDVSFGTATIEVQPLSPQSLGVVSFEKNLGCDLHDRFDAFRITFSDAVAGEFEGSDLVIIGPGGVEVDTSATTVQWQADSNSALWDLSSIEFGKGRYTVQLASAGVHDLTGQELDGDGDGQPGGDFKTEVVITWTGDTNLDLQVDFEDFLELANFFSAENATWMQGDFDKNGKVEFLDFLKLSVNFGKHFVEPQPVDGSPTADEVDDAMAEEDNGLDDSSSSRRQRS